MVILSYVYKMTCSLFKLLDPSVRKGELCLAKVYFIFCDEGV